MFSSTIALFYSDLHNLITRIRMPDQIINGYPVYKKENVEKSYLKGTENEFEALITQKLKFSGSFT